MTVTLHRSTCLVRSALSTHVSPRLYDLNSRLPPYHRMFGSCGESMNGVFQLKRYASPGCELITLPWPPPAPPPPPPPPRPPPTARPSAHVAPGAAFAPRPPPPPIGVGRMLFCVPVL